MRLVEDDLVSWESERTHDLVERLGSGKVLVVAVMLGFDWGSYVLGPWALY